MYNEKKIEDLISKNLDKLADEYGMNCLEETEQEQSGNSAAYHSYDIELFNLDGYEKSDDMPKYMTIYLPSVENLWMNPMDWMNETITAGDVNPYFLKDNYKIKKDYDGHNDEDYSELCEHIDWYKVKKDMLDSDRKKLEEDFWNAVHSADLYDE